MLALWLDLLRDGGLDRALEAGSAAGQMALFHVTRHVFGGAEEGKGMPARARSENDSCSRMAQRALRTDGSQYHTRLVSCGATQMHGLAGTACAPQSGLSDDDSPASIAACKDRERHELATCTAMNMVSWRVWHAEDEASRRARVVTLRALLRRLEGPDLRRLLRNNAGWVPAGADGQGRSAAGGPQLLLTPERVVCGGGGWATGPQGARWPWRAVKPALADSALLRRSEVRDCAVYMAATCVAGGRTMLLCSRGPPSAGHR